MGSKGGWKHVRRGRGGTSSIWTGADRREREARCPRMEISYRCGRIGSGSDPTPSGLPEGLREGGEADSPCVPTASFGPGVDSGSTVRPSLSNPTSFGSTSPVERKPKGKPTSSKGGHSKTSNPVACPSATCRHRETTSMRAPRVAIDVRGAREEGGGDGRTCREDVPAST